jgi:hypothetical protein
MSHINEKFKGTKREVGNFIITIAGYSNSPFFTVVDKRNPKHEKYELKENEDGWIIKNTKQKDLYILRTNDEDIPDLNEFFECQEDINKVMIDLFDLIDQTIISTAIEELGARSYKIYSGLENPPLTVIQNVDSIIENGNDYWKKWLIMASLTCTDYHEEIKKIFQKHYTSSV